MHSLTLAFLLLLAGQPVIPELRDLLSVWQATAGDGSRHVRIATREQWEAQRGNIATRALDIMGAFPPQNLPLDARVESEMKPGGYTRRKVSYTAVTGERIPAWLLIPDGNGPFPAVLALHETQPGGKDTVVGLGGNPYTQYGAELAARGFVVLAPDSITAGERVLPGAKPYVTKPFDRANPHWSAMGKMVADHRRGVDYLCSLPRVDSRRVGAIGHSLGGYNAYFLAAFDQRVRATVVSCGFTPLGGGSRPFAWSRESWFVHFPKLAPYLRAGIAPFDFHEVMALASPRALFVYAAARDSIFPDTEAIRAAAAQIGEVYRMLGAGDQFKFRMDDGPHEFPQSARTEAYLFLEHSLQ
jgi:dienelactone hydrolase